MGIYAVLALALALSADAFSFSVGLGMAGVSRRQLVLISISVLFFHMLMLVAGYLAEGVVGSFLGRYAGFIGAALLVFLGLRMIWEGFSNKKEELSRYILTSAYGIIVLGAAVSLDALSVGFSLGTQEINIGPISFIIGIVAGSMTFVGLGFGNRLGRLVGQKANFIGGLILIYIGIKLFL